MSFVVGLIIVSQVKDIMFDTYWLSNAYAWFALPYFVHDLRAMYLTFIWNQDDKVRSVPLLQQLRQFVHDRPLLLVHHTIMPMVIFPAIILFRHNLGDFFVGAFYMIEVTIPFISARAIMVQLNLKNTPYYIVVGLLMLFSFLVSRVLIFPYLYWQYALYAGVDFRSVPASIPIKCNLACLMILLPQLYWFWLMFRGTVRVFYKIFVRWRTKSHDV
ncbi:ceramide synthase-like [Babylonia areolata]|uniref:ceramide synthase-like n=1 Tax=Babylonia areolata TaxID=304850 RepID=UPI003FD33643